MAPLSYYWIISFIYLVIGKENLPEPGKYQITNLYLTGMIHVREIFHAAQLAPIFSFPD
jgi:hypothetical protein